MPRPISVTISVPALRHNLAQVSQQLQPPLNNTERAKPLIWAVIKANAYGHGIENAVQAFAMADGLAMLDFDEALRCRAAGWGGPLLLLEGCFQTADWVVAAEHGLTVSVHTPEQLDMLFSAALKKPVDVYVKLNTGMNRLGFQPSDYAAAYARAQQAQQAGLIGSLGKMTHFARADDNTLCTADQLAVFSRITAGLPGSVSVCNSAATLTQGLWHGLPATDTQWVRPGICLYGASPFTDRPANSFNLQPAQTLAAELISVRQIQAGDAIGYGHLYTATHPMRIGVVACGYADGYPRHAPSGTPITVDGVLTKTVGRVSMDMLVADLTPVPQAKVGSKVVLWGQGGPSVDDVALSADTIGYELLCGVAPRVPRLVV